MPPLPPVSCPHELRPGTTVCLHCRYAEHQARAARTRAFLLRAGSAAIVVAVVAAGAYRIVGGSAAPTADAGPVVAVAAATPPADVEATPVAATPTVRTLAAGPAAASPAAPPAPGAPRLGGPIIPEGRTELRGGIVAVRTGDTVAVHFDTPTTRTRRRDKFERMVRTTLPAVFGSAADSALAAVPPGRLAASGDLLTDLPTRGLRFATPNGTLALWPTTRPGRDGPLVVTYVATLER